MKLPSIQQVFEGAARTFFRFPFVLLCSACGVVAAIKLIENEVSPATSIFFKVLLAAALGLPLLTALKVIGDKNRWGKNTAMGAQFIGILLIIGYGLTVPSYLLQAPMIHMIRFQILLTALSLVLAVGPYVWSGKQLGFWQYDKLLFFRLLTAALYSGVLFAGLAIALAALDKLFGVDVPGKRYFELWTIIAGIFAPWFFLAGLPEDIESLDDNTTYPKSIKIFAQYVLFPLVCIYFVILYAYLAKILFQWNWPRGWVSGLILGFSSAAAFTFLLFYPIRDTAENAWVRKVSRWFYIILIPLVVVLFLAAWERISQYGITESRYIILALGVWLASLVVYFNLSKAKSIKFIPISLAVIAFLISFGPWGIFSVSERSQVARLRTLMEKNEMFADGLVRKAPAQVSNEDTKEISSILRYLSQFHGYDRIQPWFGPEHILRQDPTLAREYVDPSVVAELMGMGFVTAYSSPSARWVNFEADRTQSTPIEGYDHLLSGHFVNEGDGRQPFEGSDIGYRVSKGLDTMIVELRASGQVEDTVVVSLRPIIDTLLSRYDTLMTRGVPPEVMSAAVSAPKFRVKVCIRDLNLDRRQQPVAVTSYSLVMLYARTER